MLSWDEFDKEEDGEVAIKGANAGHATEANMDRLDGAGAAAAIEALDEAARHTLDILLAELPPKQAVKLAATLTGVPRDVLYAYAVARRQATEA